MTRFVVICTAVRGKLAAPESLDGENQEKAFQAWISDEWTVPEAKVAMLRACADARVMWFAEEQHKAVSSEPSRHVKKLVHAAGRAKVA